MLPWLRDMTGIAEGTEGTGIVEGLRCTRITERIREKEGIEGAFASVVVHPPRQGLWKETEDKDCEIN